MCKTQNNNNDTRYSKWNHFEWLKNIIESAQIKLQHIKTKQDESVMLQASHWCAFHAQKG